MKKIEYFNLNNYITTLQYDVFFTATITKYNVNYFIKVTKTTVQYYYKIIIYLNLS